MKKKWFFTPYAVDNDRFRNIYIQTNKSFEKEKLKLPTDKKIILFSGKYIEKNVLSEEEKGFNQMVLYGRDGVVEDLIDNAKRYPMMADRQVVIVKEAQDLSRTIEKLASYAENPQPSTVLVICYKYKTIDKRKKLYKAIQKCGLVYESKKLYENQVADWIRRVLAGKNYKIDD